MEKLLYAVFKDYGLDTFQVVLICFFAWKLASNHLKHITNKINEICERIKNLENDNKKYETRISTIEGKIS